MIAPAPPRPVSTWALLLAFHLVFFQRAYLTSDTFFLRDYSIVQTPVKALALASLANDRLPLWLASMSGGQPLLANPNYFLFHPGNVLPLLLGVVGGLKAFLLLQYLLASAGALLLARRHALAPAPALLFAISFAYGGFMCALGNLLNSLATAALLPWLLLAVGATVGRRPHGLLALALVGALQIEAGEPVPALLGFCLALGYGVAIAGAAPRRSMVRVLAGLVLAPCIAAPQVLPAALFFLHSDRAGGLGAASILKWSLPPVRLLELLVPNIVGRTDFVAPPAYLGGAFEDGGYPYIVNVFVGPVPLLLAALAALSSRRARWLVAVAAAATLLSLGGHLPGATRLAELVPVLGVVRYPAKLQLLVAFCVPLAAAIGVRELLAGRARAVPMAAIGLVASLALAAAIPAASRAIAMRSYSGEAPPEAPAAIVVGGYAIVAVTIGASLLLLLSARALVPTAAAAWLLVLLHAATLLVTMPRILPMVAPRFYASVPPPVRTILEHAGRSAPFRVYREPSRQPLAFPRIPELSPDPTLPGSAAETTFGQRQLGAEFVGRSYGLEYAFDTGWEGVTLAANRAAVARFEGAPWVERRRMLDRANVRYVVTFEEHPDLARIATIRGLERRPVQVYENPTWAPRVAPAPARLLLSVPGGMVIDPAGVPLVRVAVNGYPLWRARMDGRALSIVSNVDADEIAFEVPAGATGPVTLELEPWDLVLGLVLGALALLVALLASRSA